MGTSSVDVVNNPTLSSIETDEQSKPQGWFPTDTTQPLTISTYLKSSGYAFLQLASSNSILLQMSETSARGIPNARPTSRIAPFRAIVLNVTISEQYNPGLVNIYCLTSLILLGGKSVSISLNDTRSVFIKRSKLSPCLILSISVIPRRYATIEPLQEPRPYPTSIS